MLQFLKQEAEFLGGNLHDEGRQERFKGRGGEAESRVVVPPFNAQNIWTNQIASLPNRLLIRNSYDSIQPH